MELLILETNVLKPKLKIGPMKSTLRVPYDYPREDVDRLTKFSIYIINSIEEIQTTLEGRFRVMRSQYYISLHNDGLTYYTRIFYEKEIE
jgi:hypothetical protein